MDTDDLAVPSFSNPTLLLRRCRDYVDSGTLSSGTADHDTTTTTTSSATSHGSPTATAEAIFTGDFLFAAGAGKFFEGSGKTMLDSLRTLIKYTGNGKDNSSMHNTYLFFGHEYTLVRRDAMRRERIVSMGTQARGAESQRGRYSCLILIVVLSHLQNNLAFANWLDPNNTPTRLRLERLQTQIQANNGRVCSVPSRFDEEEATNPYIRCVMTAKKKNNSNSSNSNNNDNGGSGENDDISDGGGEGESEIALATEKRWRCTPCTLPAKENFCIGQARTLAKIRAMKDAKCHEAD